MNFNLNYEGFEKYLVEKKEQPIYPYGIQYIFRFENDYGASIVKNQMSYGHEDDLWELAVIVFCDDRWDITYNTPITDDVIGHLPDEGVRLVLGRIKDLKGE
jgi:hypothetical protein